MYMRVAFFLLVSSALSGSTAGESDSGVRKQTLPRTSCYWQVGLWEEKLEEDAQRADDLAQEPRSPHYRTRDLNLTGTQFVQQLCDPFQFIRCQGCCTEPCATGPPGACAYHSLYHLLASCKHE